MAEIKFEPRPNLPTRMPDVRIGVHRIMIFILRDHVGKKIKKTCLISGTF